MKSTILKFAFFLGSLFLSLLALELGARQVIKYVNKDKLYYALDENRKSVREYAGKESYFRDRSFEIYNGKRPYTVLALGDSYTNGGTVFWNDSYPFQLYNLLGRKITVRNMGRCEDTTTGGVDRFERFMESKAFRPNDRFVVFLMIGLADLFSDNHGLPVKMEAHPVWRPMNDELSTRSSLEDLAIYQMGKFIVHQFHLFFSDKTFSAFRYGKLVKEVLHCQSEKNRSVASQCLDQTIQDEILVIRPEWRWGRTYVTLRLIMDRPGGAERWADIEQDLMILAKRLPVMLEPGNDVSDTLAVGAMMQDRIPVPEVESFLTSMLPDLSPKGRAVLEKRIANMRAWDRQRQKWHEFRDRAWSKLVRLSAQKNITLVALTYPVDFLSINQEIRREASRLNLPLIDLEKEFAPLIRRDGESRYLDDWQHSTPVTHRLVAEALASYLSKNDLIGK